MSKIQGFYTSLKDFHGVNALQILIIFSFVYYMSPLIGFVLFGAALFFFPFEKNDKFTIGYKIGLFILIYSGVYFFIDNLDVLSGFINSTKIFEKYLGVISMSFIDENLPLKYLNIFTVIISFFIYSLCQLYMLGDRPKIYVIGVLLLGMMALFSVIMLCIFDEMRSYNKLPISENSIINTDRIIFSMYSFTLSTWPLFFLVMYCLTTISCVVIFVIKEYFDEATYTIISMMYIVLFIISIDTLKESYYNSIKTIYTDDCVNIPVNTKVIKTDEHGVFVIDRIDLADSLDLEKFPNLALKIKKNNDRFISLSCK